MQAIILRLFRFSESTLIVHALTDELGMISIIAKGALRAKSPFAGRLDLFHECDVTVSRGRNSEMLTLREVALLKTHSNFSKNYELLSGVSKNVRFMQRFLESAVPVPDIFGLFREYLVALDNLNRDRKVCHLAFKVRFLALQGVLPNFSQMPIRQTLMDDILSLLNNPFNALKEICDNDLLLIEKLLPTEY